MNKQKNIGETSDGYHTFIELYEFRKQYHAAFVNTNLTTSVKSKKHSDGELCFGGGWFIVVTTLPTGQISNHYDLKDWHLFKCSEVELAPKYDGHTSEDVLKRLNDFNTQK